MFRSGITAVWIFLAPQAPLLAQLNPAELEDAAEFARRAAMAAVAGSPRVFAEALDVDEILFKFAGAPEWKGLTERQRDHLRSAVRDHFARTLKPAPPVKGEIGWSWAAPSAAGADVLLGLRFGEKSLKTRWKIRRVSGGWKVADVVLVDPGISLARAAVAVLGPRPIRRRQGGEQARAEAIPRIAGLALILATVILVRRRLPSEKRKLLYLTASAPAILFAADGILAVRRAASAPYVLHPPPVRDAAKQAEQLALQAEREGRFDEAREHWALAIGARGTQGPIRYRMGLAARQRGDRLSATKAFEEALAAPEPAPGAAQELASVAVAEGRFAQADEFLARYLELAGPDPYTLSLQAVVKANLGKNAEALNAIREARSLLGEGTRGVEIEAQIEARAGKAARAVAILRPLVQQGQLDRSTLRKDPAYLPIATEPAWVSFINEKVTPTPGPVKARPTRGR